MESNINLQRLDIDLRGLPLTHYVLDPMLS